MLDKNAGDLLRGAQAITDYVNSLFSDGSFTKRDVYDWVARGLVPHKKHGAIIVGSKKRIAAYFYDDDSAAKPTTPLIRTSSVNALRRSESSRR